MDAVFAVVTGLLADMWGILVKSAPYVLFGFFAAAVIRTFLSDEAVTRHLGGNRASSVVKAALFGIPLPLCSCGVVPAAIGLRKQGAGRGATSAFLVSTPETGVDSISITYALFDPLMTLIRPLAAFITAMTVGLAENRFGREDSEPQPDPPAAGACCSGAAAPAAAPKAASCCGSAKAVEPAPAPASSCCAAKPARPGVWRRFVDNLRYSFQTLLAEIGGWLLLGIAIAGLITFLVPETFFETYLGSGIVPMLVMLVVGIPLYVCATASTPIAAALVLKGLSPGAALVFLLAGPATNAGTMTVIGRFLGRRSLGLYTASIAVCSLAMGLLLDAVYRALGSAPVPAMAHAHEHGTDYVGLVAAGVLLLLIGRALWRTRPGRTGQAALQPGSSPRAAEHGAPDGQTV